MAVLRERASNPTSISMREASVSFKILAKNEYDILKEILLSHTYTSEQNLIIKLLGMCIYAKIQKTFYLSLLQ